MEKGGLDKIDRKYRNLFYLFPKETQNELISRGSDSYALACHLVGYISGMSDKYAVDLFNKISGTGLNVSRS
jgi:dGTP triphosphohydrolase